MLVLPSPLAALERVPSVERSVAEDGVTSLPDDVIPSLPNEGTPSLPEDGSGSLPEEPPSLRRSDEGGVAVAMPSEEGVAADEVVVLLEAESAVLRAAAKGKAVSDRSGAWECKSQAHCKR